ncbi:DUF6903 family protein [Plantactinospora sp. KLBMP9567]|uniref:DUF6903 family protein n=1 Tax=Plantactinospora sp. KLBMP9567 TaxID=3085900 RepID=UPI002980D7F2|nr:hypothetical protein [Plantactinospora sp. KLBMP9567]MDW5324772.1 hypothetical protein [Plantactinospora sp. KLBMP9567]
MKESTRGTLLVVARTLVVVVCVAVVVTARPTVGWGSLAIMLLALAGLLAVLGSYNRRFR